MKRGDKVYCHTSLKAQKLSITSGKWYEVFDCSKDLLDNFHQKFEIINDQDGIFIFYKEDFSKYFYTEQDLRKIKINNINGNKKYNS